MRTTENITHLTIEFKSNIDRHKSDYYEGEGSSFLKHLSRVIACHSWEFEGRYFITFPAREGGLYTWEDWKNGAYKEFN